MPYYNIPAAVFWRVSRIDYAYDFFTPYYSEYIKLLRKGCDNFMDEKNSSSVYIPNKNININFYDKSAKEGTDEQKIHNIRIEVQCKNGYLHHLEIKNKWVRSNIYYLWDDKIADNIIQYELEQLVGSGDFYSLKEAGKIFEEHLSPIKAEKLSDTLKISLNPQVKLTRIPELYSYAKSSPDKLVTPVYVKRKLLPELNHLEVSPLAIPEVWHIDHLPNPWKLLKKHNLE